MNPALMGRPVRDSLTLFMYFKNDTAATQGPAGNPAAIKQSNGATGSRSLLSRALFTV